MSSRAGTGRTSLSTRLLLTFGVAYLVLIGLTAWIIDRSVSDTVTDDVVSTMEIEARMASQALPRDAAGLDQWVETMFLVSGLRFTVIATDGVVLADSHHDAETMENHADRPEIVAAKSGEVGVDARRSDTTGSDQHYVALPPDDGRIVRVSTAARQIEEQLAPIHRSILGVAALAVLVGVLVFWLLARRAAAPVVALADRSAALADGSESVIPRSAISELDRIGMALVQVIEGQRARLSDAERAGETLEVVLGALPQGTVLISGNDEVVYANPSAYELLGVVPDTLPGLTPFAFQEVVRESRERRQPIDREAEHGKPPRRLRAAATPFASDDQVLLVVVDITDREKVASIRRDFVANASHELKTPVSAIIASSEALQIAVARGDDSAVGFAGQIEHSARQLDRLVTDLLDLSRLERDRPQLDPLGLDMLVREEIERLRPEAEGKGIALDFDLAPVQVPGSRRDVAIAVRNLLDNAIRYTSPGGSVKADLGVQGEEAVLKITDTGEGIPTRDLDRVFERFYRVDSARSRATGGTGLGLAIVKHVVESHGGDVSVVSELGAGSTFRMSLPIVET